MRAGNPAAVRLFLDEMWLPEVAQPLRRWGHDVGAVAELRGLPDARVFAAAQAKHRTIVTENVIDCRLLAASGLQQGGMHSGLVTHHESAVPTPSPRAIGRVVTALDNLLASAEDLLNGEDWLS